MLWVSTPTVSTSDDSAGAKLNLSDDSSGSDEEGSEPKDDNGGIDALIKEFKGQRWDADKSVWR